MGKPTRPGEKMVLGLDKKKTRFRIQKPFGKEMVMVIASEYPLFKKQQPVVEEERQYLTTFRRGILKMERERPNYKVAARFVDLTTIEKND